MRVLVSFAGGSGHFLPTAPYARVLQHRGHQVLYACQEAMLASVVAGGWEAAATGGATLLAPTSAGRWPDSSGRRTNRRSAGRSR